MDQNGIEIVAPKSTASTRVLAYALVVVYSAKLESNSSAWQFYWKTDNLDVSFKPAFMQHIFICYSTNKFKIIDIFYWIMQKKILFKI